MYDEVTKFVMKIPVYKAMAYCRRNGLRRTAQRVWTRLKDNINARKKVLRYSLECYSPELPALGGLKKVSFLNGMLEGECKRYRVYNIVEGLKSRGITSCVFHENNLEKLNLVADSDLVIIFRGLMSPRLDTIIQKLRASGVPTIFDIDDLIFDPQYVNYIEAFRRLPDAFKRVYLSDVEKYLQTLQKCDFVTCTTKYLADKVPNLGKLGFVIPNTINKTQYDLAETILKERKSHNIIKIGYFSGTGTHDRDFLEANGALIQALEKYPNVELRIIGQLLLPKELKQFNKKLVTKPLMPYLDMLKYMAEMDINIAPLEQNTPFNEGKSELKIFEAALVGVPTIASRTDSYSRCISDGSDGFLAGSQEEWYQKLSFLIESEGLRKEMGLRARKSIAARFYIENVIDNIIKIYEKISVN